MNVSSAPAPHILIIDDDPDQLRLLVAALRETSYRVSVALKGDQGYARAVALLPDLIVLDLRMPGRDGIAIARLLKANPATEHTPILFLSALSNKEARLAGLTAGAVDYITKPFYVDEMLERIRIHLALAKKSTPAAPPHHFNNTATRPAASPSAAPGEAVASKALPVNAMLERLAKQFIHQHLNDATLRSSMVAESLHVPTQRLNAMFEKSNGISIAEFIRQERMRRAALMLAQSTLTVAEIAIEVGYENPANFSTVFKKYWGKPPLQTRKETQMLVSPLPPSALDQPD